jgi:ANTAR domain
MSEYCVAGPYRRTLRRYGRADAIYDATSLLMEQFGLDAGQAVARLVRVSKQQNDSIEAAARMCLAADLRRQRQAGAPEAVGDQPHHRRMRAEWIGHRVGAAVA